MKLCSKCSQTKPFSSFWKNKCEIDGYGFYCKECQTLFLKKHYNKNKEKILEQARKRSKNRYWKDPYKIRGEQIKKQFGIGIEQYENLLKIQNFKCAICNIPRDQVKRDFAVDHCHSDGQIRGLLCMSCNLGLGWFKDNLNFLTKAIGYLSK